MSQSSSSSVVTCPFCGYPYPMSQMQREVYIGRNMGCMNCGRPFKVEAPPPAPEPGTAPATEPVPSTSGPSASLVAAEAGPAGLYVSPETAAAAAPKTDATQIGAPRTNPVAVIGFVCALLFFVLIAAATIAAAAAPDAGGTGRGGFVPRTPAGILAALAIGGGTLAVLFSAAGLVRTRRIAGPQGPVRTAGRGLAVAGLAIGSGGLLITAIVLSTVMPVMDRQREMAHREQCKAHLQLIAAALATYANANGGHYPDSLASLVAADSLPPDALVCPSSTDRPPNGATPADQAAQLAQPGHQSYVYTGNGKTSAAPAYTVLVYEPPDDHGDVAHVLFRDGYILPVQRASAEQLRRELDRGQNPGPTAKSLRP